MSLFTPTNVYVNGNPNSLESQLAQIEHYKAELLNAQNKMLPQNSLWNRIDKEMEGLSESQIQELYNNPDYNKTSNTIQILVQGALLELVKDRIESLPQGRELLEKQLEQAKFLKQTIVNNTNKEIEMFTKFKEYSLTHPEATYDKFIQTLKK